MKPSEYVARNGILLALALILGYLEAMLPAFFAVPGMKLGIPNLVVLYALYRTGVREALVINLLRVFIVALLFGNGAALIYSLSGALMSFVVMLILKKLLRCGMMTVSMAGGLFHNLGQLIAAGVIMKTAAVVWYLPALWFAGMLSGLAVGFICGLLCRRLGKAEKL